MGLNSFIIIGLNSFIIGLNSFIIGLNSYNNWFKQFYNWFKQFHNRFKQFHNWFKQFYNWFKQFYNWFKQFYNWFEQFLVVNRFTDLQHKFIFSVHRKIVGHERNSSLRFLFRGPVIPVTLPGARRYRVSAGTGRPGISIRWPTYSGYNTVTGWDGKFDLQLLSQCGSTSTCLSRSVPEIHWHVAWTFSNQQTTFSLFSVHVNVTLNLQKSCSPFWDRYQRKTLFVVDVSRNWETNRNWQTKVINTWKVTQVN